LNHTENIIMDYRQLGNSGLRVSVIGLGTNQFGGKVDQAGVDAIIGAALDLGINLIDTADVYQQGRSEETLGKALQGRWIGSCSPPRSFTLPVRALMITAPRAITS
jgi:diketogulonate reductase-like aldo/keto reductase